MGPSTFFFGMPGKFELLMILLMGGSGGLPLGIPPLPEDPVMSRIAPEECLFYVTWSGTATPDPASENRTERILAEKEVQHFLAELERRILEAVRRQAGGDPEADATVDAVGRLAKTVLTRPTAIFLSKPDARAGAICDLGDRADDTKKTLQKLEEMIRRGGFGEDEVDDKTWHSLPLPDGGPPIQWDVKDKHLILGIGQGAADGIASRKQTDPPAWLTEVREQLSVERPANFVYLNLVDASSSFRPLLGPEIGQVIEALGLSNVQSFASVTGLDQSGCVTKSLVAIDGEPAGLFALSAADPISKGDLATIPRDATFAMATRLDLAKLFEQFLDFVGHVEPRSREMMVEGFAEMEEEFGFSFSRDVFQALGDVWRVYNSPSEGGWLVTGMTAVVDLRDRDRLAHANQKLVAMVREAYQKMAQTRRRTRGVTIDEFPFGAHTVYFLKVVGEPFPLAPAWCITDEELVFATFPQNVKAYLTARASRTADSSSVTDVPEVARLFAEPKAPLAISYRDTPEVFPQVYPLVLLFAQTVCANLRREGLDMDVSILPSVPAVARHLQPGTTAVMRTETGVLVESHRTLPVGGGGSLSLPMLSVAWFAPFRMIHEIPTPRKTSVTNMKRIGLAMHNHHDVYKSFPAAAVQSQDGKALLSWRVKVLPFVEQQPLYDQFHLDEPWDSPHNKQFIAKMPAVYRTPRSKVGDQGKTNYLGVSGKDATFFGGEKRWMGDIGDGTSSTMMVVEASDEKAVIWTKPDDFEYDPQNPIAGLVGQQRGGFLALLCDGSVQFVQETIPADLLKAALTIDGGELIDWDEHVGAP